MRIAQDAPLYESVPPVAYGATDMDLPRAIAAAAEPLPDPRDAAFGNAFDRYASSRVVLLGEASHGTSEFYRARAAITRRLIEAHGCTIVALEADWPDAATLDRSVRPPTLAARETGEPAFRRFPTWMWRNVEVAAFVAWLREHNRSVAPERRVGLYGLDLYNLAASMRAVIDYLDDVDPAAAQIARRRYGCLEPWRNEPADYGRAALDPGYARCEDAVVRMLVDLQARRPQYAAHDGERFLDATANARLVQSAEAYYRAMYRGAADSWNLRDRHMFDTLREVVEARGAGAKAVVWAHNSHIGDARETAMGRLHGELNIGQLCRQHYGEDDTALIGMGTHAGTVAAASDWDAPMQVMDVRPSLDESCERIVHDSGVGRGLVDLRRLADPDLREALLQPRLERFIGVIYRPDTERWSHYAQCSLARQLDAYLWFDQTRAVTPLSAEPATGEDDTYPFAL